jgi:hypothetical protein
MKRLILIIAALAIANVAFAAGSYTPAPFDFGKVQLPKSNSGSYVFDTVTADQGWFLIIGSRVYKVDSAFFHKLAVDSVVSFSPLTILSTQINLGGGDVVIQQGRRMLIDTIFPANGKTVIGTVGDTTQFNSDLQKFTHKTLVDSLGLASAVDTVYFRISNDTVYIVSKKGSYFLNLSQAMVLFKAGWMLFDQMKPATNDSASSSFGSSENPYGKIYACSVTVAGKSPKLMVNGPATLGAYGNDTIFRNTDSTGWRTTINGTKILHTTPDSVVIDSNTAFMKCGTGGNFVINKAGGISNSYWAATCNLNNNNINDCLKINTGTLVVGTIIASADSINITKDRIKIESDSICKKVAFAGVTNARVYIPGLTTTATVFLTAENSPAIVWDSLKTDSLIIHTSIVNPANTFADFTFTGNVNYFIVRK